MKKGLLFKYGQALCRVRLVQQFLRIFHGFLTTVKFWWVIFQVCYWVHIHTSCFSCVIACPSSDHFASQADFLEYLLSISLRMRERYYVSLWNIVRHRIHVSFLNALVCLCKASWQRLPHARRSQQPGDWRGQGVRHHTQHQCQVQCCTSGAKPHQLHEELPAPHR